MAARLRSTLSLFNSISRSESLSSVGSYQRCSRLIPQEMMIGQAAKKALLGLTSRQAPVLPLGMTPRFYSNPRTVGSLDKNGPSVGSDAMKLQIKSHYETGHVIDGRNLRDHKRRIIAAKFELKRKLYKAFCKDPNLARDRHRSKLAKLPRDSSLARVRNRCVFSGRPRSVYRKFRISRIVFRGLASRGELMGVKKASW